MAKIETTVTCAQNTLTKDNLDAIGRRMKEMEENNLRHLEDNLWRIAQMFEKSKGDGTIHLLVQKEEFYERLMCVISETERLINQIESCKALTPASMLLRMHDCENTFNIVSKTILKESGKYGGVLDEEWQKDVVSDKIADIYLNEDGGLLSGALSDEITASGLKNINSRIKRAKRDLHDSLASLDYAVGVLMNYESSLFEKLEYLGYCALLAIFENSAARFDKQYGKAESRSLEKQVRRVRKKRLGELTSQDWEEMLTIEEEAMQLAVKGCLTSSTDSKFDIYNKEIRKDMEENRQLLILLQDVLNYNELFDFRRVVPIYKDYLNGRNYLLFCWLVYRANIIRCRMDRGLDSRYKVWQEGGEYYEKEEVLETEEEQKAARVWKNLQEAGLLDENLMPTSADVGERGALAYTIADELNIKKRWKYFTEKWKEKRDVLRKGYERKRDNGEYEELRDKYLKIMRK